MNNISELDSDLNIISKLSDQPNTTDGLSPSALKAKFDLAGNTIENFINTTLVKAVNSLIDLAHSHANMDALNAVTASTVSNAHSHANIAALNTVTASTVENAHTHANKTLLDAYTQTEANLASAVSNKHTHGNKSVLDGITSDNLMMAGAHQTFSGTKTFSDGIVDSWSFTLGNVFVGTENALYGNSLPGSGTVGQIFFKKV